MRHCSADRMRSPYRLVWKQPQNPLPSRKPPAIAAGCCSVRARTLPFRCSMQVSICSAQRQSCSLSLTSPCTYSSSRRSAPTLVFFYSCVRVLMVRSCCMRNEATQSSTFRWRYDGLRPGAFLSPSPDANAAKTLRAPPVLIDLIEVRSALRGTTLNRSMRRDFI